jgi:hypothetical protein
MTWIKIGMHLNHLLHVHLDALETFFLNRNYYICIGKSVVVGPYSNKK